MHVGVIRDVVHELIVLVLRRQLAVAEEPRHLEERRAFRELLDRISAVAENSLVTVDIGDGAPAGGGVEERRVVAHQPRIVGVAGLDLLQIVGADGTVGDGHAVGFICPGIAYRERPVGVGLGACCFALTLACHSYISGDQ